MANRDWMYDRVRRGGLRVLLTRAEADLRHAAASLRVLGENGRADEAERVAGEVAALRRPTDAAGLPVGGGRA